MAKLIYTALVSLDGFIADDDGVFDWAEPGEDVHRFINSMELGNSVLLCGRGLYEIMKVWDMLPDAGMMPEYIREFEIAWKKARKIVFSSTLGSVDAPNTLLKKSFLKEEVEELKRDEPGDIGIGGAGLASQALGLGLIDEIYLFVFPVLVGSGKKWIKTERKVFLEKMGRLEFRGGVNMVQYGVKQPR